MRAILVDWIVDVHHMMKLQGPTLWLTVNLIDRTLARRNMPRTRLQLVGIAALSLACKMEEIALPYPDDFTYITEDAYSCEDLLAMELEVLQAIHYEVHVPTGYHFLTRYLDLIHATDITRRLAFYYAERNLQETTSLALMPSAYAAVCLYAALVQRDMHGEPVASDVPTEDWEEVVDDLHSQLREIRAHTKSAAEGPAGDDDGSAPPWADVFPVDDIDGEMTSEVEEEEAGGEELMEPSIESVNNADSTHARRSTQANGVDSRITDYDKYVNESYLREYREQNEILQQTHTNTTTASVVAPSALPSSVYLWDINVSCRAPYRQLTRENYPVHPSQMPGMLRAKRRADGAVSSSDAGAPPLDSPVSRIARLLAHLPPQQPKPVLPDVSEGDIAAGVSKLLQELPGCVDLPMLSFYAKLVIEHVGKEVVSTSKRHLNAARRKYSSGKRHLQVGNCELPFFTVQDPTVYTQLLGPILHRSSQTFYPGKMPCCAEVKLLNPSHFPIPDSSTDLAGAVGVQVGESAIVVPEPASVAPIPLSRVLRSMVRTSKPTHRHSNV